MKPRVLCGGFTCALARELLLVSKTVDDSWPPSLSVGGGLIPPMTVSAFEATGIILGKLVMVSYAIVWRFLGALPVLASDQNGRGFVHWPAMLPAPTPVPLGVTALVFPTRLTSARSRGGA